MNNPPFQCGLHRFWKTPIEVIKPGTVIECEVTGKKTVMHSDEFIAGNGRLYTTKAMLVQIIDDNLNDGTQKS
jgi:hypothetical protein